MQFRFYVSILLLSTLPRSNCNVQPVLNLEANFQLGITVATLVNKLLAKNTKAIDILTFSETESQKHLEADFLSVVLQHLEIKMTVSLSGSWEPRRSVLILADSHISFRTAILSGRDSYEDFTGYFLVFITQSISSEELSKILKDSYELQIINISIIVPRCGSDDLVAVTYFPFSYQRCFDYRPIEICIYIDGQFVSFTGHSCQLYPPKLENFYGCKVVVNVYESPPYLFLMTDPQGQFYLSGLEGEILNTIAGKLNFEISILVPNITEMDDRVAVFTSGPANISIGRLRATTIRRRNVSSSVDYHKNELVMVTHAKRSLTSLERLFIPASCYIWLSYLLILSVAYIVVLVVDRKFFAARQFLFGAGNRHPTYWILVTALGGSVTYKPRRNFARYMLMQWIVFNFFIRSGYQAFFYRSLRLDFKASHPRSLDELLDKGYSISSTADILRCFSGGSLTEIIAIYNGTDMEALQKLEETVSKVAVIVPEEFFSYYQRMNPNSRLSRIEEPLIMYMLTMHLRRNSYLKMTIDCYLLRLRVSGFLTRFRKIFMARPYRSLTVEPKTVELADICGHFELYAFFVFNSIIALGLELASLKVKWLRRVVV